ncbi:MAG: trypsin-like peptidase domain-containing protein [Phycisphaerae bacterium]|nr:trypsin-like peptidase domain-containing protein [Phycisphaerae bacterium]
MTIRCRRATIVTLLISLAGGLDRARGESIHLKSGSVITAPVISRKADRIFVDMGFTVMAIPADAVDRIVQADGDSPKAPAGGADLWTEAARRPQLDVKQNVARCEEAVVQVRTATGLGSGFVIHRDGYILTNDHVVAGEHKISITLYKRGKKELKKQQFNNVRIIATSPHRDLALLKIEDASPTRFHHVPLGQANALRQGQTVFAIGSPLGLERSLSQGVVSLRNRAIDGNLYVQTTAQINPGNSGGPLFNLRGEVVGITNMKIVAAGTEGLGFAIPIGVVKQFLANRDAFAFDPRNPNAGFRYNAPPDTTYNPPPRPTDPDAEPAAATDPSAPGDKP